MSDILKTAGVLILAIALMALLAGIGLAFMYGIVWIASWLYPLVQILASLGTTLLLLMLLPSAIFKGSRNFCGAGIVIVTYIWGLSLWLWIILVLYEVWGLLGLFVAAIFPFAILLSGQGGFIGSVLLSLVVIGAVRALGFWIMSKGEPQEIEPSAW